MGIELVSQILSLNNARRCRHSKNQLVSSGASFRCSPASDTNGCEVLQRIFRERILISYDGWRVACLVVNNLNQKERVYRVGGFRAGCSNPNLCAPFYFRDFVVNLTFQSHSGHLLLDQSRYWLAASVP
jgi:hypothetical protein